LYRRTAFRSLFAVLAVLCLGLQGPRSAAAQAVADEVLIARIDALAAKTLAQPGAAGLSIAVARGDTIILGKGYGQADVEHGVPATDSTLFRIGSVTKQYTAAAIMRLVEQGKLGLDDDFTKYVDYPTQGKVVTIRHLLNHTSGIKSYTAVPGFAETGCALDLPPAKVLDPVRELPFDFEPGTKSLYSNSGYHLLGMVIEKVSDVSYARYLQDEFFTPLNLVKTRYDVGSDIIPGRARGYRILEGKLANAAHIGMTIPFAAGSLMATAGDLVAWQLALVAGKVVSLDSYTQMATSGIVADGTPTGYGFGLFLRDLDGRPRVMHGGGIFGFNSTLEYYPEEKLSIAVISNSESVTSGGLAKAIAREAVGVQSPDYKDLTLPAAEIEPLLGTYRIKAIQMDLTVTTLDGKVLIQGTGQPSVAVMAQGNGEFRADWDHSLKVTFDAPPAPGEKAPSLTLEQGGGTFKGLRVP
jgi:D-alanyl-D-alanine carboxypeptidase